MTRALARDEAGSAKHDQVLHDGLASNGQLTLEERCRRRTPLGHQAHVVGDGDDRSTVACQPVELVEQQASVAAIFWPGVPMYDTVAQYGQVLSGAVDDWHPPVMVRLWQLLHPLGGGTAPMFALQVALYAGGFALIVAALARAGRWRSAIAAAVLALSPLLLGWQMVVLKDEQMLGSLLASVGIVAHYRLARRAMPIAAAAVVALLILYATLVRANGLFATVPLAVLLLPTRKRPLVSAGLALAVSFGVLFVRGSLKIAK